MHFKTSALLVTLSACNFGESVAYQYCSTTADPPVTSALSAWVDPEFPLNTAAGWKANGFATGLTRPRGVTFDSAGNLLVVDVGVGIVAFKLNKDGSAASNHTILADLKINHGIALNAHGNVLFARCVRSCFFHLQPSNTLHEAPTRRRGNGHIIPTHSLCQISRRSSTGWVMLRTQPVRYSFRRSFPTTSLWRAGATATSIQKPQRWRLAARKYACST